MRALFDIVHPAHVHFYRHLHARLTREGHECAVLARERDVTLRLLDAFGIPYEVHGSPRESRVGQATELVGRDLALFRLGRRLRPDIVFARNPAGMHAARLLRTTGVFDTDDGEAGGSVFRLAARPATIITTPDCLTSDFGPKHLRYPGYKALAFLHPNHFVPDPAVPKELGLGDEPYAIVRVTAMQAAHDHDEVGVSRALLDEVIAALSPHVRVLLSCEGAVPEEHAALAFPLAPEKMHDTMAFAQLVAGDSGSMVAEAAVLGTPAVFYGSFARRREYLPDLERRWGLARTFDASERSAFLRTIVELAQTPTARGEWQQRRSLMLTESVDVSDWYYELACRIHEHGAGAVLRDS